MIEVLVIGATVIAVAGMRGVKAHQRHLAGRTLERYARVRGHRFAPESVSSGRASPRVDGVRSDIPFVIDFCRIRRRLSTRVSADVVRAPAPRIAIVQRSRLARALGLVDDHTIAFSHEQLRDAYGVRGATVEEAQTLFERHEAKLVLLDGGASVWIACDGARASVTWAGVETDTTVIDAARDLVIAAAGWHRADAPYR